MTEIAVGQSDGVNIVSIPKAIVQTLGLSVGSKLDLTIQDNSIVLTPVEDVLPLEALLAGSPKKCFAVADEDRFWIDATPADKEV